MTNDVGGWDEKNPGREANDSKAGTRDSQSRDSQLSQTPGDAVGVFGEGVFGARGDRKSEGVIDLGGRELSSIEHLGAEHLEGGHLGADIARADFSQDEFSQNDSAQQDFSSPDLSRGGIIAARGTVDGLVIRIDGRVDAGTIRQALDEFVSARSSFLAGQEVFLEWVGIRPALDVEESLIQSLTKRFGILVKAVRLYSRPKSADSGSGLLGASYAASSFAGVGRGGVSGEFGGEVPLGSDRAVPGIRGAEGSSLFEGVRTLGAESSRPGSRARSLIGADRAISSASSASSAVRSSPRPPASFQSPISGSTLPWDEPDARLIHATLRSGQKIESEHSLVIVGDVNSGAEVISGGDLVILGTLRGVAHAGAYEESGGGRVIFALNMQPTQLRIGSVISRGSSQDGKSPDGRGAAEVARVDGNLIVVEPYHTKTIGGTATVGLLGRRRGVAI